MKFSLSKFVFPLVLLWTLQFPVLAQPTSDYRIDTTFENQPLSEILDQLKEIIPIHLLYRAADLPTNQLTVELQGTKPEEILDKLLNNAGLGYEFYRNYAVIIGKDLMWEPATVEYYQMLESLPQNPTVTGHHDQLFIVGDQYHPNQSGTVRVTGTIQDVNSNEPIIGSTIYFSEPGYGTATDVNGHFEIDLPIGQHHIDIQYVGYEPITAELLVFGPGNLEFHMFPGAINLDEVVVEEEAQDASLTNAQISTTRIDLKNLKKMPAFLGESDIVKTLQLQSGVSTVGEGASGFNVRGGNVDQNLIMQNEGFIFNSSHALGFFSTFNSDLIKEVTLYKGIIPARFGGRLSSVLDVKLRDGSMEEYSLKGGLGPITSTLTVNGPVLKERSSFIIGMRSTYSDWVLRTSNVPEVRNSSASFYDLNIGYAHRFSLDNTVKVSFYSSHDTFNFNKDFGFEYETNMGQIMYDRSIRPRIYSTSSIVASNYISEQSDYKGTEGSRIKTGVSYLKVKEHIVFSINEQIKLDGGFSSIFYRMAPQRVRPLGENSVIAESTVAGSTGLESAGFLSAEWEVSPTFKLVGGVRLVFYRSTGPGTVYLYEADARPMLSTRTDTVQYKKGEKISAYTSVEPRLSFRYKLGNTASIKGGYSRVTQFINQISNFSAPTPTSVWQLSTPHIGPSRAHNISIGYFRNFRNNLWEGSIEGYYRFVDELYDYQDFAQLNANEHIETELLPGVGRARGLELSIKRKKGKLHGWFSYTLSRTEQQADAINNGKWYPGNFDKLHDLSLITIFQPNQRHSITVNFNYGSGRPITAPIGVFRTPDGFTFPLYSERNQLRLPDYHRLDVAYAIGQGYNKTRKFKTSWVFSIYNVYGRKNAYSVYFEQRAFGEPKAKRFSVLGSAFPSVTFKFEMI